MGRGRSRIVDGALAAVKLGVLAGTLALAFGFGTWLAVRVTVRSSPEVTVPDLVGKPADEATRALEGLGLAAEVIARRYDPRLDAGEVITQIPGAGSETRPGRPVRLVVSLGARRATVPDLSGANQARAEGVLRAAGLSPGPVAQAPDPGTARGRVLGQHPAPGTEAAPGDRVSLLVSAGADGPTYVMPDLSGRPAGAAAAALGRRGFRRVTVAGPGDAPISATQPRAGFPVAPGDAVTLTSSPL